MSGVGDVRITKAGYTAGFFICHSEHKLDAVNPLMFIFGVVVKSQYSKCSILRSVSTNLVVLLLATDFISCPVYARHAAFFTVSCSLVT